MPQLSMHSIREMMGISDLTFAHRLFVHFFKDFRRIDDSLGNNEIMLQLQPGGRAAGQRIFIDQMRPINILTFHFAVQKGSNFHYQYVKIPTDFRTTLKYLLFEGILQLSVTKRWYVWCMVMVHFVRWYDPLRALFTSSSFTPAAG